MSFRTKPVDGTFKIKSPLMFRTQSFKPKKQIPLRKIESTGEITPVKPNNTHTLSGDEEIEVKALRAFHKNLLKHFNSLDLPAEEGEYRGLPYPNKRNIGLIGFGDLTYGEPIVGLAGHYLGQRESNKQANFIHIPPFERNLFIAERSGRATMYARYGSYLTSENKWVAVRFKKPIPLHSIMAPDLTVSETEALQRKGIQFLSDARTVKELWPKDRQKQLLVDWDIPTLPFQVIKRKRSTKSKTNNAFNLVTLLRTKYGKDFVLKPTDSFRGNGVYLADIEPNDTASAKKAFDHLAKIRSDGDVLVEPRINCYPYLKRDKKTDWNIRLLVTKDINGEFVIDPIRMGYVRTSEYKENTRLDVNFTGKEDLDKFFTKLFGSKKEDIYKKIEGTVRKFLANYKDSPHGIYGFDIYVDKNENIIIEEANLVRPGGIKTITSITIGDEIDDYKRWGVADPFAEYLIHLANKHYAIPIESTSKKDRQYLNPNSNFNLLLDLGYFIYYPIGEYEKVIDLATQATKISLQTEGGIDLQAHGIDEAFALRGKGYLMLGEKKLAWNDFIRSLEMNPRNVTSLEPLNKLAEELDLVSELITFFDEVISRDS